MGQSAYSIEELVADSSFQDYCLGTDEKAVIFWEKWQAKHPDQVGTIKKARELYYQLNGNLTSKDFNAYYNKFQTAFYHHLAPVGSHTDTRVRTVNPVRRLIWAVSAVAACLLVIAAFFMLRPVGHTGKKETRLFVCLPGQKMTIGLRDGTKITLNGGSTLKIDPAYHKKDRKVMLDGEGYFVVAHHVDMPFIVHTSLVNIRDLGTTFNVKAFSSDRTFETALIEGSIEITAKDNAPQFHPIVLVPNKKIMLDTLQLAKLTSGHKSYKILPLTVNRSNNQSVVETDWTENRLTFEDDSLEEVVLKLERWYGVKIHISATADRSGRFNATFNNEKIEQVLQGFRMSGNFNYKKEGNEIDIY